MSTEIKGLIETLNRQFEEFKSAEQKGRDDLAAKINTAMSETEAKIDEVKTAMARSSAVDSLAEKRDAQKDAFMKFVRKGDTSGFDQKALSTDPDADGGYAVPEGLVREVGRILTETSDMRMVANVVTTSTGTYEKLWSESNAQAGWVGEKDARPATDSPTLGQILITPGEMYAKAEATQRIIDDAFFDVEGWLVSELADKFSRLENTAFINGDGVNKPKGLLDYAKVAVEGVGEFDALNFNTAATPGTLTADDLIGMIYSLKPGYRNNGSFAMNRMTLAEVRKLKQGVGEHYIWQPALAASQPSTILGFPVHEFSDMPAFGGSPAGDVVAFGDFRQWYYIVDRVGIRTLRDPYSNKPYVQFYCTKRVGGGMADGNAGLVLTV